MRTSSWKETLVRALRTFFQSFISYLSVNFAFNASVLKNPEEFTNWILTLFVGAIVSAGIAVSMNLPKKDDGNA